MAKCLIVVLCIGEDYAKGLLRITFNSSTVTIYVSAGSTRTPQNLMRVNDLEGPEEKLKINLFFSLLKFTFFLKKVLLFFFLLMASATHCLTVWAPSKQIATSRHTKLRA